MPTAFLEADSCFTENYSPHDSRSHGLKKIILRTKTRFQNAVLAETHSFGRCLILDDEIQSAELDEFIYHESLVQPAMALHAKPRDILILGGGEGATVREILRHPGVRQVTMVDIDGEVVEFCRRYLSSWHQGALDHPKTRLFIEDALTYTASTREKFDIIFSDLPTPQPGDLVEKLYSLDFYRRIKARLNPGGLLVVQSGSGSLPQIQFHAGVRRALKKLFKVVRPYYSYIPSFDEPWAFLLASQKADPQMLAAARIDKKLGTISRKLRFYDGQTHEGLFRIPKYLRAI